MSATSSTVLPDPCFTAGPTVSLFKSVRSSVETKLYDRAIRTASDTIDRIEKTLLVTVLEHRAYSLGMQGQFELAIQDAKKIISYAPSLTTGYVRLGHLYAMQGKQQKAIHAFDTALKNFTTRGAVYDELVCLKQAAIQKSETRVDFIAMLPIEVVHDIFTQLSSETKSTCLQVSRIWRKSILQCKGPWKSLTSDDSPEQKHITNVLPHIATYIENLSVYTKDSRVWIRILKAMRSGSMDSVKTFRLGAMTVKHIQPSMVMALTNAFWKISNTLTKLELDLTGSDIAITLLDLLHVFANLKTLDFTAETPLAHAVGEPELLDGVHGLVDLTLKFPSINGPVIQPVLQQCQHLRRLILSGSHASTWNVVNEFCPDLEIFGYNPKFSVAALDENGKKLPGLRHVWALAPKGSTRVPAGDCLAMLQRYMRTIETAHLHLSASDIPNLDSMYAELKLDKLKRLIYCGDPSSSIESLLLRSIVNCTELANFCVAATSDIKSVVNILLVLPPLKSVGFAYTSATDGHTSLKRLFDHYATISRRSASLESIMLRWCSSTTDEVLMALSGIKTLQTIRWMGLSRVTSQGMQGFLQARRDSLTTITLVGIPSITDIHLIIIGDMPHVETVNLEDLEYITDDGLVRMVDKAAALHRLSVMDCKLISEWAMDYAASVIEELTIFDDLE